MESLRSKFIAAFAFCIILTANASPVKAVSVGVKSGDWIKLNVSYVVTPPSGTTVLEWLKIEFVNVTGTTVNATITMHATNSEENNQTVTFDMGSGSAGGYSFPWLLIPANSTIGYSVNMGSYGNATIAEETTGTYAGTSRTVLSANVSQYGTQSTYWWDKQTGVLVQISTASSDGVTATASETNMWSGGLDWWIFAVVAVIMVIVATPAVALMLRRRKPLTPPTTTTTEQPPPAS